MLAGAMVFAPIVVFLLLAFIRWRRFHYAALVALLVFYLYMYWRATLAA